MGSSANTKDEADGADRTSGTSKPPPTPLPWLKVLLVGAVLFANQFSSLVIFPFLPFMVHGFFPDVPASQLGTYAGVLGAAFHVGSLSGSIMWGRMSDYYGRRPVMLAGITGTFTMILFFGFARTYWMAVAARFFWGALNGNIGVAKAYLAEVCDDSNQARGYAVIGLFSGVGRLAGPAIGAFLADPVHEYPGMFGHSNFLAMFPYVLPSFAGALVCIASFVLAYFYLEETVPNTSSLPGKSSTAKDLESGQPFLESSAENKPQPLWKLLQDKCVAVAVGLYGILALNSIAQSEMFPLWALTDRSQGGLNFRARDIGIVMLLAAPAQIVTQVFIFPYLSDKLGYLRLFQTAVVVFMVTTVILPSVGGGSAVDDGLAGVHRAYTLPNGGEAGSHHAAGHVVAQRTAPGEDPATSRATTKSVSLFITVATLIACSQCSVVLAMTSVFVMINNSCRRRDRGAGNGIGQTCASLGRCFGPALAGSVYAWSQRAQQPWPFDYHFVFYMLGAFSTCVIFLSRKLPTKINHKLYSD